LSLPANLTYERLEQRRELQKLIDEQSRLLDISATARGLDAYYDKALAMLNSERLRNAFDLSSEPEKLRDDYGRHTYGQSCLLARRLVEAGVKFVTVYFSGNIGGQSTTEGGWDTHGFNNTRMYTIIENASRDHWPQCYTTLLAGGGVKRGFIYGASDKNGMYPAENPVRPDDLAATIFYLLGIDPHTEVRAVGNRPVLISEGKPRSEE